jgi:hypothetical protein
VARAYFRFYAELNDFLPPAQRGREVPHYFPDRPAVKDRIEALGVPHPEVDLILVNGVSVGFAHLLEDGDRVSVYPHLHLAGSGAVSRVRPEPPRPWFVLDVHLGRLATGLRLLGFDTLFGPDFDDAVLARCSSSTGRILLTRDRGLLKRGEVVYGYCVRSSDPNEQGVEVLRRFDLFEAVQPFRRCLRCNGRLAEVAKEAVAERLEPRTLEHYDEFYECDTCGRLYWKGSHYDAMLRYVERVRASQRAALDQETGDRAGNLPLEPRSDC